MAVYGGPDIVTDGLVLHLDAANDKSYDPIVEDCSLVLNMEGSNGSTTFTDGSKYGHTVTANGNTQISTGNSRFGASSAYFDGNGDYVQMGINNAFVFGTGQFTVEFWIYWNGTVSGTPYMGVAGVHNSNGTGRYGIFMTSAGISHYIQTAFPGMASLTANKWVHVASTRDQNGVCRFFLDGVVQSTVTDAGNLTAPQGWRIGTDFSSGRPTFPGYIDSFRVVKGKALYTENFTPPKKSFPEYKWGDLSGNENNGTFVNGVAYGNDNYGVMSFDGSNDYVDVTDVPFRFSNSFTVGIWIYWDGINQLSNICGKRNDTNPYNQYNLSIIDSPYTGGSSNKVTFFARRDNHTNSADDILLQYALPESGIYYIVGVASPSSQVLYVNTVSRASSSKNISSFTYNVPNKNFRIGDAYSTIFFNGNIYQCQLYNRGLSSDEITQNFEATKGRYGL